jgi:AAA family ATP:ADP antiporter
MRLLIHSSPDTLVVTQCGAEAIAFLKIYGVLPAATAFIAAYSKLSNVLDKRTLFYVTCLPFFAFFGASGVVVSDHPLAFMHRSLSRHSQNSCWLSVGHSTRTSAALFDVFVYPNASNMHPSLESVQRVLGGKAAASTGALAVLARIVSHWTSGLFYVVAEIYSSVSVGLLFWQFANDVVSIDQAKRFYPLFAQMSGLAPVLAGQYVVHYASQAVNFEDSLHRLTGAVSFAGLMICLFFQLSTMYVERTEGSNDPAEGLSNQTAKKAKPKMSLLESAKFLAGSQYLRLVATLVLGYGLSINFTEIMWKSLVKKQYPNPLDYQRFMGNFSSAVGLSTCVVIFFGVHIIRLMGWRFGALATPCTMAILAIPFFACIIAGLDTPSRLAIAVLFGTLQSLLSKAAKYALFDPTTQMAYIPLDAESKIKGKAAIDVLGSRIGKSGASFFQQGLVFVFGNILNAAPVVGIVYYAVLLSWIAAANRLSVLFHAQTDTTGMSAEEKRKSL